MTTLSRLQELLAARKASATALNNDHLQAKEIETSLSSPTFELSKEQQSAIDMAMTGMSFCLTGPAGTGKTTTVKSLIAELLASGKIGQLTAGDHRYLPKVGAPGIVICSFTNKAVSNIRVQQSADLHANCLTVHKLLEFQPEEYVNGEGKASKRFTPNRHRLNPLPSSIQLVIVEESSMLDVPLWNQLWAALPHHPQVIFIGDIQQLQPVFGKSIYIHGMQKGLPIVELTHVYRQALKSPILSLAHRILSGKAIPAGELKSGAWNSSTEEGTLTLVYMILPKM